MDCAPSRPPTPTLCPAVPPTPPVPLDTRREGILHRAVRDAAPAVRAALVAHPESVRDVDRQRHAALHIAADAGLATVAIFRLDAARTPTPATARASHPSTAPSTGPPALRTAPPECLSTLAALLCFSRQTLARRRGRRPFQLRYRSPPPRRKTPDAVLLLSLGSTNLRPPWEPLRPRCLPSSPSSTPSALLLPPAPFLSLPIATPPRHPSLTTLPTPPVLSAPHPPLARLAPLPLDLTIPPGLRRLPPIRSPFRRPPSRPLH